MDNVVPQPPSTLLAGYLTAVAVLGGAAAVSGARAVADLGADAAAVLDATHVRSWDPAAVSRAAQHSAGGASCKRGPDFAAERPA